MAKNTIETTTMLENAKEKENTAYVFRLALVAALGGLLFGYDTAVISGAIGFLETKFSLGAGMKGFTASCALLGCIVGASTAGTISDRLGRKKVLFLAAILFAISAIGSAIPRNLTELVIARIVGGIGVGMASVVSPLYISEVSPARVRGRLVSLNQFAILSGMLVVYFVNAVIAAQGNEAWNITLGWRWMFGSEVLPALVFFVLLFFVPESPRWLSKQGEHSKALAILTRIGGPKHAEQEIADIEDAISHEGASIWQLFHRGMRIPLIIGVCLAILQQVTGINTVMYYAPEIFKKAGMGAQAAINHTVLVGLTNLVFTLIAIWWVDKVGRKPLMLITSIGMGFSLFMLGRVFVADDVGGNWPLFWVLAYVASFAVGMGPIVWVIIAEIFPTRIRGRGMGIATATVWVSCFAVSQLFPVMLEEMGGKSFYIYASMCVVCFFFVLWCVPETKGKSLEEIERQWIGKSQ